MVAAIEDRVIGELAAMLKAVREQAPHDAFGLGFVIRLRRHADRIAVTVLAPQLLGVELGIVRDQRMAERSMRVVDR